MWLRVCGCIYLSLSHACFEKLTHIFPWHPRQVYELDDDFKPIPHPDAAEGLSGRYLGDADAIAAEAKRVADQAKAK